MPLRVVIFDLDQTLVDSSALEVYRSLGLWGDVINGLNQVHVFPGVLAIFQVCRAANLKIAVVTASPRNVCEAVLAHVGLQVDAIVASGEAKFSKPSLHPIINALRLLREQAADVAVLGDRCVDIASGKNAKVPWTIAAKWGSSDPRSLILSNPKFIANNVGEAEQLLTGLLNPAQYQAWLNQKEQEANSEYEQQMWVDHGTDVDRGHLIGGDFPYYYCRKHLKGTWAASYANALVSSLKLAVKPEGQPSRFKVLACEQMANEIRHLLRTRNLQNSAVAFIPGSKKSDHAKYDPRFEYVAAFLTNAGIRVTAPIITATSHEAVHTDSDYEHRAPHVIRQHLEWHGFEGPVPAHLFLVDDVITSGGHFRACVEMIREHHSEIIVIGTFWAAHLSE